MQCSREALRKPLCLPCLVGNYSVSSSITIAVTTSNQKWERRGLLEFKDFLKSNGADADHLLPTWVKKPDHHSECCDWERVTCDRTTGHVTELFLQNVKDVSYEDFRSWFINASLFLPFKELQSLTLSYNSFGGWTDNEGMQTATM
ncbi:hypothetical protein TEA_015393 [Camellia sinensis var. sinensis]|uniref:Leucine-rich repeat-containing N-terminal plant-type domain-containing protein n=1 Tax=Camellia sinensis var. sinensis TaxID=542762 RepID=A0A4S4EEW4_CAMSN|nr:hypothetical protein TEA_015393 [Camellia sinensis var. sinensis]